MRGLRNWPCDHGRNPPRRKWYCHRCRSDQYEKGHRCQDCGKRVCCSCFHHDYAACFDCCDPTL